MDYLGTVIFLDKFEIANVATSTIKELKSAPTKWHSRLSFGLCNLSHRFEPNCSGVGAPHNKKLRKDEPAQFHASSITKKSGTEQLKFLLSNAPLLVFAGADGNLTIETDACDSPQVRILLQKQQDETMRPIAFWERTLVLSEKRLATTHKEILTVL